MACPRCGQSLTDAQPDAAGMLTCACGYRGYAGYLWEYTYLDQRRRWLWDRITEQSPPPDPVTAREYRIWPVAPAAPAVRPRGGGSTQMLLVGLGASLLILAGLVFVAVAWDVIGPYGQLVLMFVATLLTAGTALALRHRTPRTAESLAVVSFALAAIIAVAAPALGVVPSTWADPQRPYWLLVTLVFTAGGLVCGHLSGLRAWTWLGWLSAPWALGAALGVATGLLAHGQFEMTLAALAYLALATALLFAVPELSVPRLLSGTLSLLVSSVLTLGLLTESPPLGAIVTIAAVLLVLLVFGERIPVAGYIGWPLFGLWLTLVGALLPESDWSALGMALVGAALLFWLGRSNAPLGMVAAGTLWTAWIMHDPTHIDLVTAVAGIAMFLLALRPAAAPVAWFGALSVEIAVLLRWEEVPTFETPTLVLAALLLVAGLLQVRAGERRTLIVYAPAITFALIPSALLVWVDIWAQPALIRFGVVMVCGVALLLWGVHRRLAGLVVPSAAAVGIAATAQVFATLDLLPRWLALGVAGGLLLLVGARLEWVRGKRTEASAWLHTLT